MSIPEIDYERTKIRINLDCEYFFCLAKNETTLYHSVTFTFENRNIPIKFGD